LLSKERWREWCEFNGYDIKAARFSVETSYYGRGFVRSRPGAVLLYDHALIHHSYSAGDTKRALGKNTMRLELPVHDIAAIRRLWMSKLSNRLHGSPESAYQIKMHDGRAHYIFLYSCTHEFEDALKALGLNFSYSPARSAAKHRYVSPEKRLGAACGVLLFIALFNIAIGLLAGIFGLSIPAVGFEVGYSNVGLGFIFFLLAIFSMRGSIIALLIATVLFVLDTAGGIGLMVASGQAPPIGGSVVRIIFIVTLLRAFPAVRMIRQESRKKSIL